MENLVGKAVNEVEKIKHKIVEYKTSIQNQDEYIHRGEFYSNYTSTGPFFVWPNEKDANLIFNLLSGKEVTTIANILASATDKDAIKFNLIEVNFKAKNKTIQSEIDNKLKGFKFSATHLGNSYFRCANQIFKMGSPSQNIEYSFERNADGVPVDRNDVYIKIQNGDLMLSPYALWKFKLIKSSDKVSFSDLEKYKNEIDLELVGEGSYLARGLNTSSLEIDKYYPVEDVVDTANFDESSTKSNSIINKFKTYATKLLSSLSSEKRIGMNFNIIDQMSNQDIPMSKPKIDYERENGLVEFNTKVDTNANLLLGQIVVGKLYGANNNLRENNYLSPHQERTIKTNEIERKVSYALSSGGGLEPQWLKKLVKKLDN